MTATEAKLQRVLGGLHPEMHTVLELARGLPGCAMLMGEPLNTCHNPPSVSVDSPPPRSFLGLFAPWDAPGAQWLLL